ncbi:MAG: DUF1580 domain-containing protein [Planctomycetes bacterium]|nr:DUF1580 domain-containing protein [Planctomycetota bacterium]
MSIDVERERLQTFNEAAEEVLPHGSRPSYATWWRWWRHGVHGVRLETVRVGGRRLTSAAAVRRFLADVTAAVQGEAPPVRTHQRRQRDRRQAKQVLADAKLIDATTDNPAPANRATDRID